MINPNNTVALSSSTTGQYVSALGNGGGPVRSNAQAIDSWETFMLFKDDLDLPIAQTGSCIRNNDKVGILTRNRHLFSAPPSQELLADQTHFKQWEKFEISFPNTPPNLCLEDGDTLSLIHI